VHLLVESHIRDAQSGVRIPAEARDLSLFQNFQTGSVTHPASHAVDAGCSSFGEVKVNWVECEADNSPQSSAEIKDGGIPPLPYTSLWCLNRLYLHSTKP
jgi:hypothetical protein